MQQKFAVCILWIRYFIDISPYTSNSWKNVKDKNSGIYLQKLLNKLTNTIIPTTETS